MLLLGILAVIIVVAIIVAGFGYLVRQRNKRFDFVAPSSVLNDPDNNSLLGIVPEAIPTVGESTDEILEKDFAYDASDDLLDPNNPRHAQWVHEHPDAVSEEEREAAEDEGSPT